MRTTGIDSGEVAALADRVEQHLRTLPGHLDATVTGLTGEWLTEFSQLTLTDGLPPRQYSVSVRAQDSAGNTDDALVIFTVGESFELRQAADIDAVNAPRRARCSGRGLSSAVPVC